MRNRHAGDDGKRPLWKRSVVFWSGSLAKASERRAEMRRGVVGERVDLRMTLEHGLNNPALDAASAAVNQPHVPEAGCGRGVDVLGHDRRDVARREGVEIDFALDRDADRIFGVQSSPQPQPQNSSAIVPKLDAPP